MEINFNLEGIEDEAFFALYSGLRKVRDHYRSLEGKDECSLTAAAAQTRLVELHREHKTAYEDAQHEYDLVWMA